MSKISKNYNPVKFYLDPSENEKTLGDVILGTVEDIERYGTLPEYRCFRCHKHFTLLEGDICSWCVDEITNNERSIQEEIDRSRSLNREFKNLLKGESK